MHRRHRDIKKQPQLQLEYQTSPQRNSPSSSPHLQNSPHKNMIFNNRLLIPKNGPYHDAPKINVRKNEMFTMRTNDSNRINNTKKEINSTDNTKINALRNGYSSSPFRASQHIEYIDSQSQSPPPVMRFAQCGTEFIYLPRKTKVCYVSYSRSGMQIVVDPISQEIIWCDKSDLDPITEK